MKNKVILIIDTSDNKEIKVGLIVNGVKHQIIKEGSRKAQLVLPMIEEVLKNCQIKLEEITEINVNTGPGSFTGLRVGIAIANALGFGLGIPVNGKKPGELVEPKYK